MNNIYKVIWSKAKNCYVVASEIARSHTKSATGSEKIGGVTRRSLLASLMALSLLCGGLGVATASLEVVDQSGTDGTVTIYTKDEVDKALDTKGAATDVETNKAAIADLKNAVGAAGSGLTKEVADQKAAITANTKSIDTNKAAIESLRDDKLGKDLANSTFATKGALNDLTTTVNNKVDESVVEAALQGKADKATTLAGYGINDAYTKDKVDEKLDLKANAADVYTKTDADGKFATSDALTTAKTDLEEKITTAKTELDGKIAGNTTKITANEKAIQNLNAKAGTTETTLTDLSGRMAAAESDIDGVQADMATAKSDIGTLKADVSTAKSDITSLKAKDTELSGKIDAEIKNRITSDTALDQKIDAEIKNRITSDTALDQKIDKEIKNRITSDTALDQKIDKEIQDRKDAIGTIADNKNYIEKDKSVSDNLVKLDAQATKNADAIAATNKRTAGIKRNDATNETTIEGNVTVDNLGNVKAKGDVTADGKLKGEGVDAGAGDITTTGAVNAGSLKVENASQLKGDVTMDKTLSVTGDTKFKKTDVDGTLNVTGESSLKNTKVDGTLITTGKATFKEAVEMDKGLTVTNGATTLKGTTVDGALNVTGESSLKNTQVDGTFSVNKETTLNGTLTAKGEAKFEKNVTIEKDLTVNGKLNVGEIAMENKKTDADGTIHNSSTTITADGITHHGEVKKSGVTTESQFTHTEKGSETYAKKSDTTDWTETRSDVTADGVKTEAKDSKGNRTNTSQTAEGINGSATDKDGNKTYTKVTATENSFQIQDKDGKNKNHQVNTKDSSVTEITNAAGATTKTEQTAKDITNIAEQGTIKNDAKNIENNASENITNTAQNGTITNDAKDIVNNATGDMTNTVGGKLTTTVTGQATENFNGGLDTNVTGTENHTVTGDQENIIGGNQTTTVTGDISNKAENITNEANTKLTDKVGDNTRVLDSEGITDTVPGADGKGSTFKQRIDAIMGNVKTDAGESEVTQKGDEITSVVGKGEATNSRVTQKKNLLETAVTDGTNYNISNDTANASAKELTDGTKVNKLQDNLDSSEKTITNGTYTTSKLQTALDITNTAKDGTITNDAKNIVNNATGDMTNTVGGDLKTTVSGNELHEVTGTKTENVTGKVTENYGNGQETNVTGDQNIHVTGKQTNKIDGDQVNTIGGNQTTTVTGDISNKAENITNEANTKLTDKVGDNTRVLDSEGITDTVPGADGKGSTFKQRIDAIMGNVKTDAGESEVTQKGDEITSVVGKGEATNSRVTQKKNLLETAVTDGTNYNISNDTANASAKELTDGTKVNKLQDNLDSSEKTITNGTYKTSKLQTALDITNTAKDGTITNDAKDIVNNASGDMTNTVGGKLTTTVTGQATENFNGGLDTNVTGTENHTVTGDQNIHVTGKQTNKIDGDQENTIGGNQTTTVTGDISNKAKNITNEASNSITDKVGDHTRVLDSDGITDTVGGSTFKQRIDKIMMESKDVSIKAEETLTNEAKVITNKASEVINNEAVNINNTATGIITSKASEIKNQADKLISNKVGENTWENMENGKITTSIKDGAKQNLTQSDAAGTTQSTVDGNKSTVTIQNADGLTDAVRDGAGNENGSVATATTSANTIKSGSKANTVISTADGTSFINSEAAAPVTGESGAGTAVNTTIKGNTITTGKVTMDYAEVMKDLGVRGNANITGKTTTGSLEVTGTSTLKGDVTMGSSATVKKDLTVEGNTNLKNTKVDGTLDVTQKATFGDSVSIAKDLSVDGNATIKGDVTAKSYKVGEKTYIDENGINANDQKITNVADGSISEGSKDAVNGGQLYTVKNDLEGKVNKVGANAAAMANLHPMEFDPDSKWNIAAAIGNYGSETAAALGAFYRPNDDVMVNLSTAFGTGENMVGGGVSVRLGKGGNKLSREESNALKDQVNDLTARMDALLSVLNPNMSKDFPDVPENHWAYEAVSRLAGNDIVQGYPDGEFHGERTMTRYEMAEIIYNALSRGAEAEKELVEEFKPELQAMAASEKATAERAEG